MSDIVNEIRVISRLDLVSDSHITLCQALTINGVFDTSLTDHSHEEIKHLKIGVGFVAAFLAILGPFGLYTLYRLYRDKLHNKCVEKVKQCCGQRRCCVPNRCCQYGRIQDNNNNENADNQNEQPA